MRLINVEPRQPMGLVPDKLSTIESILKDPNNRKQESEFLETLIYFSPKGRMGTPALTKSTSELAKSDEGFKGFDKQHPLWELLTTARFFMIRSNCNENLAISIKHSEWATT